MSTYFYEDIKKKFIKESLLTTEANKWAESFIYPSPPQDRYQQRNPQLTSAQLRKFHIEAKNFEEKVKYFNDPNNIEDDFKRIIPLIKMMKSKVAYACPDNGRDRKVPLEFRRYLETMVDNINDVRDFKAFCLCFEAVVGYYYGLGGGK
ncbi:MAG: type III-A CRISPR-associated protein Csm2 [Nitrospirae bacterium]|nr:type III-A CRISPR-associated protein Csm2 [Nitrospirota bacterium]